MKNIFKKITRVGVGVNSAFFIVTSVALVIFASVLTFVPPKTWKGLFSGKHPNLATVLNPAVNYPVGSGPLSIFYADFNNDGKLDLVTANGNGSDVSVLINNGSGGFLSAVSYPVGNGPNSVYSADINNDGKMDLVTSNYSGNNASVLIGNGSGGFSVPTNYSNYYPNSALAAVSLADFNNDGKLDLFALDNNYNIGEIRLGDGAGGFATSTSPYIFTVGLNPASVFVADFNNDGKLDLAVANTDSNNISIHDGDGLGEFAPKRNYAVDESPYSVYAADFDNDGKLDLATANDIGTISVLLGNGSGGFSAPTNLTAGINPDSIFATDINNDGKLDLVTANQGSNDSSVFLGDGTGAFSTPISLAAGSGAYSIIAADLNNDGKQDLVTANNGTNNVSVLLSTPDIGIPPVNFSSAVNYGTGIGPTSVTSADLNNDGKMDLAVTNSFDKTATILYGNGSGTFSGTPIYLTLGNAARSAVISDVNNDGKKDLLVANYLSSNVYIFLGLNNGTLSVTPIILAIGNPVYSISIADLNNDGKQDLVAIFQSTIQNVWVYNGNGDGSFSAPKKLQAGNSPSSVFITDLNNDGKQDLAVPNYNSNDISVLIGSSTSPSQFNSAVNYSVGTNPITVYSADFNNDGKKDLAVSNSNSANVSVLIGNGDGTFQASTNFSAGNKPLSVFATDLNNDGKKDLVVSNSVGNNITPLLGNGAGGFTVSTSLNVGTSPLSIFAGDFNNDGKLDLVSANGSSANVSVFLAVNPNPVPITTSISPASKITGDIQFTMTVNGTGFINSSTVRFNGSNRTTTFVSPTQITATILASDLATVSTSIITVFNPAPGGGISNSQIFSVNNLVPIITSINPTSKITGDPQFTLTVNGINYLNSSIVQFNGLIRSTTFVNPTQLTATIPSTDLTSNGTFPITVINPAPPILIDSYNESNYSVSTFGNSWWGQSFTNTTSNVLDSAKFYLKKTGIISGSAYAQVYAHTGTYGVNGKPIGPALATSDPFNVLALNSSNQLITFTFSGANKITLLANTNYFLVFNYSSAGLNWVNIGSDNTLPTASGNSAQTISGSWSNSSEDLIFYVYGNAQSNPQTFTVTTPNLVPTISNITPTPKTVGDLPFTLFVNGTNFVTNSIVRFNNLDRSTVYVSPIQLAIGIISSDLTVPGAAFITVFNPAPGGGTSNSNIFSVNSPAPGNNNNNNPPPPAPTATSTGGINLVPVVLGIGPSTKNAGDPQFTLTVSGSNFVSSSVVQFNGLNRTTTFINSTQLNAQILSADLIVPGVYHITVFNPAPGGGTSTN